MVNIIQHLTKEEFKRLPSHTMFDVIYKGNGSINFPNIGKRSDRVIDTNVPHSKVKDLIEYDDGTWECGRHTHTDGYGLRIHK